MFLSVAQAYILIPVIAVVVLQYAFALFCLTRLAYLDISKKNYILWNVFILVVFFIGGIVFLIYYYKHPDKLIPKTPEEKENSQNAEDPDASSEAETNGDTKAAAQTESGSKGEATDDTSD